MTFFRSAEARDRVRTTFLEYLCSIPAMAVAKAVAALEDEQFDALCHLASNGYNGTIKEKSNG